MNLLFETLNILSKNVYPRFKARHLLNKLNISFNIENSMVNKPKYF